MPKKIQIELPELHEAQEYIFENKKRFNVLRCGRRFGKTICADDVLINTALDGYPAAYFTPIYKTLEEVWNECISILGPLIVKKNSQLKYITLVTGGQIDFWSLKDGNAPRGRKYKVAVIDEAAYIPNLINLFNKVIRPLLTDYRGEAWFMSSPNGENDFSVIDRYSQDPKKNTNWQSFHFKTSDNPYISKQELQEIKDEFPEDVYLQEYEAEYVIFDGKHFINQAYFKDDSIIEGLSDLAHRADTLFLCYDFNITNTCLVIQNPDPSTILVLKEYHVEGFDLEDLCKQIKIDFPKFRYMINGDANGSSGSALTSDNNSGYEIIGQKMKLGPEQFNIPASNPRHKNSYQHCNAVFKNFNVLIDSQCTGLITDIKRVKVQVKNNKFEIVKTDDKLTHHLDPLRYHICAEHQDKITMFTEGDD